ncbi:hypothetical protein PHMEG_0003909 [Phytophthora megakarya]|uniref:Uncharacterized protein n=1 Tax=Phytophthora megakarya TaxID=4795 RepID=A0A225WV64_9STRA|nr:hypothetical protein PHMEG_0003909 [Phytophthora megakarya]
MELRIGRLVWVRLTNLSDGTARCYTHFSVVVWVPSGDLPREEELAGQPPLVARREYRMSELILERPAEDSVAPDKSSFGHLRGDGESHSTKPYEDGGASSL